MESQEIKRLKQEMRKNSISLQKFLIIYYGLYNESMYKTNMTHKNVKQLLPYIKRISFEELLKKKHCFYTGEIISVIDSNGDIAPYINPKLNIEIQNYSCTIQNKEKLDKFISLDKLNIHELRKLSKKLKEEKNYKSYRGIQKILKTRTCSSKNYKIKKLNMKGND